MSDKISVDEKSVRSLAKILEETGLTEIEYQIGDHRIRVVRGGMQQATAPHYAPHFSSSPSAVPPPLSESPISPLELVPQGETISSPMVGTVYLSSEPGGVPFVKAGDSVKKGDTLLIIEAMKVMNPIRAPREGKILTLCVTDANPVEFGEPLIILE